MKYFRNSFYAIIPTISNLWLLKNIKKIDKLCSISKKAKDLSGSPISQSISPVETIDGIIYKRINFPKGKFVNNYLARYPEIQRHKYSWPQILAANLGRKETIILLHGFKEKHMKSMMRGRTVHNLVRELNNTIAFIDWMQDTYIEELVTRGIADWLKQNGCKGIKLFGASQGAYFVLRMAKYFKELEQEGFNIPLKSLVTVVAPTSRDNLKPGILLDPDFILGGIHLALSTVIKKAFGIILPIPGFLKRQISDVARVVTISKSGFKKGDFPEGLTIHYFATDPKKGNIDKIVDQPKAIQNLQHSGASIVIHEFQPGSLGHVIKKDDRDRMNKILINILKGVGLNN